MDSRTELPNRSPAGLRKAVLFVDVVASTEYARTHGDVAWRTAIDRHARAVSAVAERRGGSVENFTGDGFMVFFDDPGQAVECALLIRTANAVQHLFEIRIGLDAGEVLPYGDRWYVGMTLHVASRLTDRCGPGEIMMSERCYRAARRVAAIPPAVARSVTIHGLADVATVYVVERDDARCDGAA